jgi:ATP synthase protein I
MLSLLCPIRVQEKRLFRASRQDLYKVSAIDLPHARRLAFGLVLGQAAVTLAATLCAGWFSGRLAAGSAALGGGIATLGSLAMAALVFGRWSGRSAQSALTAFYLGEAVKIVVVVALFVVVLKVMTVAPLAMLATFAVAVLVYWIVLIAALPAVGSAPGGA